MDVCPLLVTDAQVPLTVQPRWRALDDPVMPAEPLATLDATQGNMRRDTPLAQPLAQRLRVIRLVGMQLPRALGPPARGEPDRLDDIHSFEHHLRVVDVGRAQHDREREVSPVYDHMAFSPRFAAICRILPSLIALFAGTLAELFLLD